MMVTGATEISDRVSKALLQDNRTNDSVIDVSNEGGKITLSGSVDSEELRQAAEEIARSQSGVVLVINDLKIN